MPLETRRALEASDPAGGEVFIRLALALLPFAGPEPSLLRIDPAIGHLTKQDGCAVNRLIWKAVYELM
jgi:hypothetical protein